MMTFNESNIIPRHELLDEGRKPGGFLVTRSIVAMNHSPLKRFVYGFLDGEAYYPTSRESVSQKMSATKYGVAMKVSVSNVVVVKD